MVLLSLEHMSMVPLDEDWNSLVLGHDYAPCWVTVMMALVTLIVTVKRKTLAIHRVVVGMIIIAIAIAMATEVEEHHMTTETREESGWIMTTTHPESKIITIRIRIG